MVRELNPEASDAGGLDWIGLSIPMGALNTVYGVGGFPFGDSPSDTWRGPLDDWLARIGKSVFAEVAFPLALVGHEVSGATYYEDIQRDGLPPERWFGYLLADNNGLEWFPPTIYEPPMQFP